MSNLSSRGQNTFISFETELNQFMEGGSQLHCQWQKETELREVE